MAYNERITERLKEFDALDAGSFAFRYPVDRNGSPTLQGLEMFNVKHVRDVVTAISNVLDGSSIGIYEHLRSRQEMMAEYAAEMRQYQDTGDCC